MSTVRGDELAAVAIGGVVGALARAWISLTVPHTDPVAWPWATFVTNLLGCFVLGVVLDWVDSRHSAWLVLHPRRARLARPLLASGVLGGFTTFSAFSLETALMIERRTYGQAFSYAAASVLLSISALFVGLLLARRIFA